MNPTPSFQTTRTHFLSALMIGVTALSVVACGDDGGSSDPAGAAEGEACQTGQDCQAGLLCVGLTCRDPNGTQNNDTLSDAGNNDGNNDDNNDSTNNDTANNDDMDAGMDVPVEDTGGDGDGDDMMGDADSVERPETLTGGISIFELHITTGNIISPEVDRGNAGAAFVEPGTEQDPEPDPGACLAFQYNTNPPNPPFGYDAGTITVTGGRNDITLTPTVANDGSTMYPAAFDEENEEVFDPDTSLQVAASGGAHVDAFSGLLTTPTEHSVTAPAPDALVSGADNLTVSWNNSGSNQDVVINVIPLDDFYMQQNGTGINCNVGSDSGSFEIPRSLLDQMSSARAALSVVKVQNTEITSGPDTFVLNATYAHGVVVKLR